MMASRLSIHDLKRAAKTVGARVEHDDPRGAGPILTGERWETYQVIAPDGHVWACNSSIHMLKVEWCVHDPRWKHEAIEDAIERIAYGIEPCRDDECEYCHGDDR